MHFFEILIIKLISTWSNFFRVKNGKIGDLPDFDFFRLASLERLS